MSIHHYDLFAGIGGFSLALERVFNDRAIKHTFSEWEEFPTVVLKRHWPDGEFYGNITELIAHTESEGFQGRRSLEESPGRKGFADDFTIVTGGFPCQPFSTAGKRNGTADDRYQWPNMFRVIKSVKPDWVVAENVRGLATWNNGLVLEQVCVDLESQGYEVQPFIIPAVAVNAPHRRDRVWVIANRKDRRSITQVRHKPREESLQHRGNSKDDWDKDWREVAVATCLPSMDDGLPRDMDGTTISYAKWRNESIKAYGNAIVPQVAEQIFRAIKVSEATNG